MNVDRYANGRFFLLLNLLIILLTETVGGGTLFFDLGIIHVIALLFIGFAAVRLFAHYYTFDPMLETFVHASLAAMGIFALSHIVEFVSIMLLHLYTDAVYINVANAYLISMLLITMGAESFLHKVEERTTRFLYGLGAVVVGLAGLSVYIMLHDHFLSLDLDTVGPYVYTVATVAALGLSLVKMHTIQQHVDFTRGFVRYLSYSLWLIGLAIMVNIYYDLLTHVFALPVYQSVYLAHFGFYAALSFLFISFGKMAHLGGMLEEVKNKIR